MGKIEIRPIEKEKWHGKTGKENYARPHTVQALVDGKTRQYATGLDEETRKKYEEILQVDLSPIYIKDKPHSFWDSSEARIKLTNKTMFLDSSLPLDFIKVQICKASKYVANSKKEYEDGLFPEATHIIYDESEGLKAKATKVQLKKKLILDSSGFDKGKKIAILQILTDRTYKSKSDNFIEVAYDELIDKKPKDLLQLLSNEDDYIATRAMILEGLQKSVLTKSGYKYYFMSDLLGNSEEEVISFLLDPENQTYKLQILDKIN